MRLVGTAPPTEPAVPEYVAREHVDLATGVAEECPHAVCHPQERPLARQAGLLPVGVRNDEEQMLRVLGKVCFPDVLEVVVVGHRAASLDLRDDPLAWADPVEEVRPGPWHDAVLGGQQHLFVEPETILEDRGHDRLHRGTAGTVDMSQVDRCGLELEGGAQSFRQLINSADGGQVMALETGTLHALVFDRHGAWAWQVTMREANSRQL
jgi:hypothetical protein